MPSKDIDCELRSFSAIVKYYQQRHQKNAHKVIRFFSGCRTYDEVLERAAYAKLPSGKRHPHQYRLKRSALRQVHRRLKQFDLESCTSFHELFETIHEAILEISGIGELMIYDTAFRIGAYLGLEPEFVYLHAGTRTGAVALGHDRSAAWIEVGNLPPAFRHLKPWEIEDCLCIYNQEIQWLQCHD